jgi:hypothetical protein
MVRPPVAPTVRTASPAVRSAAARTSRAASPATSSVGDDSTKKKKAAPEKKRPIKPNKSVAEIFEEEKLQRDIEVVIAAFKPEYKHKIECEDEWDI